MKAFKNNPFDLAWPVVMVLTCLLLGVQASGQEARSSSNFFLRDGDHVVFYGDSITAQLLYTRFIEAMVVSRYPGQRIHFYNAGVSGDTVLGGSDGDAATRVRRDVEPLHPTVVTISLGANDGRYTIDRTKENLGVYAEGYRELLGMLKQNTAPGARFTLITPIAYDEISQSSPIPGYNGVLLQFGGFVRSLAAEQHYPVAAYNEALTAVLTNAAMTNGVLAKELVPDHVRPSLWGHWVLATEMMKTWGFDPLVSYVALDYSAGGLESSKKATVSDVHKSSNGMTWSELENCLPLPIEIRDPLMKLLLPIAEMESIDQEVMRVTGLPAEAYRLTIDDKLVAIFSREQLAQGVNLALYPTPMRAQALSIDWDGAERRTRIGAARHSLLAMTPTSISVPEAVKTLDLADEEVLRREYEHAQPLPHRFALIAATAR